MTRLPHALVIAEPFELNAEAINRELEAAASSIADAVTILELMDLPDHRAISVQPLVEHIRASNPDVVLLSATLFGRECAPRIAARLGKSVAADVTNLRVEDNGTMIAERQVYGGSLSTEIAFSSAPALVSLRPGAYKDVHVAHDNATTERIACATDSRIELMEVLQPERAQSGLATAKRVVSGGRGLGKPENFHLVEQLADALDAAVGASGAVVGMGWRPHSQQVGSTGTTVAPRLYVAVGISGAVQHTIGMSESENILAINRDVGAPIFEIASLGVVGDLFEVVPAIITELNTRS